MLHRHYQLSHTAKTHSFNFFIHTAPLLSSPPISLKILCPRGLSSIVTLPSFHFYLTCYFFYTLTATSTTTSNATIATTTICSKLGDIIHSFLSAWTLELLQTSLGD